MNYHYEHEDDLGFSTSGLPSGFPSFAEFVEFFEPALTVAKAEFQEPVRNTDYEKLFLTPEDEKFLAAMAVRA